jgi:hypothetical protein
MAKATPRRRFWPLTGPLFLLQAYISETWHGFCLYIHVDEDKRKAMLKQGLPAE